MSKDIRKIRGSIYDNNGYWYYDVRLPGELKRHKHPLCAPNSDKAMRSDRPKEMAIEAAHRLWEKATRQDRGGAGATVDDICGAYLKHTEIYYRTSGEASTCACALRVFRELHGQRCINELIHTDMLRVRDALIRRDLARTSINKYIAIISNRLIPWALDEGLIPATTAHELSQVKPLKRNRSEARECEPVRPIDDFTIGKTIEAMMPNTADMVRVHRLTGMRPDELCMMRWEDIDTSYEPWIYRPRSHKNEWRGKPRVILIGKKARAILDKHRETLYPFSPVAAVYERMQELRRNAVSPARYSRANEDAAIRPREHWDTSSYTKTIQRACRRANVPLWSANQLRHTFATEVRRKYGLDACRAVLGHSDGGGVTDRYSREALEDEIIRNAQSAVEALG